MLVQVRRDGGLRLFRQHDHALLAGELAASWRGPDREPAPLPFDLALATALHDLAWRDLDAEPLLDPASGRPTPFHELPLPLKRDAYARGLDQTEEIHPYAALLGSLHYASFPDVRDAEDFQRAERSRRERLRARLGLDPGDARRVEEDRRWLALFDRLSLFVCLLPPSSELEAQPSWVEDARHLDLPTGGTIHLTWMDDEVLHVDPFPFRAPLDVRIPYRELPERRYGSAQALRAAWDAAPEAWWGFAVRPAPRLA